MKLSTRILILLVAGVLLLLFGRRMIAAGEASARAGGRPFWEKVSGGEGEKEQASTKSQRAQDVAARAEREALLARLWEQVLEQHPELVMERLPITRQEDAFCRYNELCEKVGEERWQALRTGLKKFEEGEFDVVAARDLLEGNRDLLLAVRELAGLPCATLEFLPMGFISAGPAMNLQDLLLLESRIRLAEGDGAGALESAQAVARWEEKFAGSESNLLVETVNVLQHLGKNHAITHSILPSVAAEDYPAWTALLQPADFSPSRLAIVLRGEAFVWRRDFLVDAVGELSDAACLELVDAVGDYYAEMITGLEAATLGELCAGGLLDFGEKAFQHPSAEELYGIVATGADGWYRGYARAGVAAQQTRAVAEVMAREANGEDLAGIVETRTVNSATGQSFLFDMEKREVRVDDQFLQLIPIEDQVIYSPLEVPLLD